MFQDVGQMS